MSRTIGSAEYLWLDGTFPTQQLRSKTRIIAVHGEDIPRVEDLPRWSFDGSSTNQATGSDSDCLLEPVGVWRDPIRGAGNLLVLCEVLAPDGTPHETNMRATLRAALDAGGASEEPMVGFEQEYTLFAGARPAGFPGQGYPAPQGPYYCGVGVDRVHGRELVEAHLGACLDAELMVYGINAEVMPGQWEFQLGYRGFEGERGDALRVSDELWVARWLLHRLGETHGLSVSLDPKPARGDWNGAGAHTNFSTRSTRHLGTGLDAIHAAVERLVGAHDRHIAHYGADLADRLTGLHETCSIGEFRSGVADRGASIRIPRQVVERGAGYFEDRRPGANCDPYVVCRELIRTVCGLTGETSAEASRRKPAMVAA
jgi:glutamine synthetase